MSGMRVILTGATGFIGSYVLRQLIAKQCDVAILLRKESDTRRISDLLEQTTIITGTLDQPDTFEAPLKAFSPDVAIHCAWDGVGGEDRNNRRQIVNFTQSINFLEACFAAGVGHWVGLGSQAEYGPHEQVIDELVETKPTTLYGTVKLATCTAAQSLCRQHNMTFSWVRIFSTYGPSDSAQWMIPSLILALAKGERPQLTAGTQLWDYLHVVDAARAICHVAGDRGNVGVFNLGSGTTHSIRSIVESIGDLIDPTMELGFGEIPMRADQVMHLQADIGKLERAGWKPQETLAEGLRQTVKWYSDHQAEFTV